MRELALFAGAGGGILGGKLLGWRTVCAVEVEPYARAVLLARQRDGWLDPFPVWDDVRTFDGNPWRGHVDVISGGFPCQDISSAGKRIGIDGARSGLWSHMARVVGEVRPRFVFVENSPALIHRGLDRVLGDLAELGFDAEWSGLSAAQVGAPHLRERFWLVAHACCGRHGFENEEVRAGRDTPIACCEVADSNDNEGRQAGRMGRKPLAEGSARDGDAGGVDWPAEPGVGRMAHGVVGRVDRLKALGNGQVPRVAAAAFEALSLRDGRCTAIVGALDLMNKNTHPGDPPNE